MSLLAPSHQQQIPLRMLRRASIHPSTSTAVVIVRPVPVLDAAQTWPYRTALRRPAPADLFYCQKCLAKWPGARKGAREGHMRVFRSVGVTVFE